MMVPSLRSFLGEPWVAAGSSQALNGVPVWLRRGQVTDAARAMPTDPRLADLARLRADLERHDRLYYAKATPEISDSDYDDLKDRYERLADELEIPAEERHQKTPGSDHSEGFQTVRHDLP